MKQITYVTYRIARIIGVALIGAIIAYGITGTVRTNGHAWCATFKHFQVCSADANE